MHRSIVYSLDQCVYARVCVRACVYVCLKNHICLYGRLCFFYIIIKLLVRLYVSYCYIIVCVC